MYRFSKDFNLNDYSLTSLINQKIINFLLNIDFQHFINLCYLSTLNLYFLILINQAYYSRLKIY